MVKMLGFFLILAMNSMVYSYPDAAGSCRSGKATGLPHSFRGKGSLSNGSYELRISKEENINNTEKIDSIILEESIVNSDNMTLVSGHNYNLQLVALDLDEPIKGFLIRMSATASLEEGGTEVIEMSDYIWSVDENVQSFPIDYRNLACDENVGAVCHNHNDNKEKVEMSFFIPSSLSEEEVEVDTINLHIDVTVVQHNTWRAGYNGWFFSGFDVIFTKEELEEEEGSTDNINNTTNSTSADESQ